MFFGLFPLFFPYQGIIERRPQIPNGVLFLIIACGPAIQQPRLLLYHTPGPVWCLPADAGAAPACSRSRTDHKNHPYAGAFSVPPRYKTVRMYVHTDVFEVVIIFSRDPSTEKDAGSPDSTVFSLPDRAGIRKRKKKPNNAARQTYCPIRSPSAASVIRFFHGGEGFLRSAHTGEGHREKPSFVKRGCLA